jgi:predicted ATPase/class 3 adenylate cyclase
MGIQPGIDTVSPEQAAGREAQRMVGDLPSGTVTFLFTDIEGSTRLLRDLGEQYAGVLAEHQHLLRAAFEQHQGRVVSMEADSSFVAFPDAVQAVAAASEAQRSLAQHPWPPGTSVRVRMGLHTGQAQISSDNYVGMDVHRAARIAAAGHGGQVLLSQTTYALVERELPAGVTVRDLGQYHLKDLRQPKQLYQLLIAGLQSEFPALKSLNVSPNNLPRQLTSFVGRSTELGEITALLAKARLVTLTGPGGSGKTRLALQVATRLIEAFQDGVFFVALAPISDPRLVASTIAQALGLAEITGRSMADRLKDYLRSRALLLVLDNFEQVIAAAPLVADLLAACGGVKFLVTSRERLGLSGERLYPVPSLALPDLTQLPPPPPVALSRYPAVELFVQRAQAVKPDFRLTSDSTPAVVEICRRLDGLPLAIELAAARTRVLAPPAMLARLAHRLDFLTGGARDQPARQQTLRNAIAWSYALLDEAERQLFRRLAVFVGGFTLAAAEAVAADETARALGLDQLESLLDKSLLRQLEGGEDEPRFIMLELLREFGLEQLSASGEEDTVRHRHAAYYLSMAEQAEGSLEGAAQIEWMDRMEQAHDNLRAALEWSTATPIESELGLRLANALGLFWEVRGHFSEGRDRLSAILASAPAQARSAARAKLLARAAELAYRQSDYTATRALATESLAICRARDDREGMASALIKLGNAATEGGDYESTFRVLEEALSIWRALGDNHGTARALISLGWAALRSGDNALANERLGEALVISRQLGDTRSIGFELSGLGEIALRTGQYARATQLIEESLALRQQLSNKWGVGVSLGMLGWVAMHMQDWARAATLLGQSLEVRREIGDTGGCAWCLERLAEVALARGRAKAAVQLFGAAAELRAAIGSVMDPVDQQAYASRQAALRADLGEAQFAAGWAAGQALSLAQAAALALEDQDE